ncbi:MAG: glycosyltransferase, partial [Chitinivibrionales bacterium]|nr:glycosyltransferase [Chitinivibrionales bacterium]
MKRVAVIIPTFNRRHCLGRCLKSVLNQTFDDYELMVVDDCSTDGTEHHPLLSEPRVGYEKLPARHGVSFARNYGVQCTTAPLLAFCDSDDEWHTNKLEHQCAFIDNNPSFRISQTKEIWIRHGIRVNPPQTHEKVGGDIFEPSLHRCMITPSSVIIDRDLFRDTGGFNESFVACEDYDLWLRITWKYMAGLVGEYLLTRYGGHDDQLSSTVFALDRFRIRSILNILYRVPLSVHQRIQAKEVLVKKANIVARGFKKRGDRRCYEQY